MMIAKHFIVVLCVLFALVVSEMSDSPDKNYAMSIVNLDELFDYEEQLVSNLENYAKLLQESMDSIAKYVSSIRVKQTQVRQEGTEDYLSNPLNSFALMRHMHMDWHNLLWSLEQQTDAAFAANFRALEEKLPIAKDLTEAIEGVQRLQEVYDLKPADMAVGKLSNVQYNASLTPLDCYAIAAHLAADKDYDSAVQWFSVALDLYKANQSNWPLYELLGLRITEMQALYAEVLFNAKRQNDASILLATALVQWPNDSNLMGAYEKIKITKTERLNETRNSINTQSPRTVYQRCCAGECHQRSNRLHCLYNTTASYFLRLAPVKMEILSLDPYIVLYHNVIYATEIAMLRRLTKPHLVRAQTFNEITLKNTDNPDRTTKSIWIKSDHNDVLRRIERRVADVTNFLLDSSEPFQIMNYGIGGHYKPHYDFFNSSDFADVEAGDRLATILFYLSDVPLGGATVFPDLELAAYPKRGTALLWYNLDHRGFPDDRTMHGACPTLMGSRWVMTKWINDVAQMFQRPCPAH